MKRSLLCLLLALSGCASCVTGSKITFPDGRKPGFDVCVDDGKEVVCRDLPTGIGFLMDRGILSCPAHPAAVGPEVKL